MTVADSLRSHEPVRAYCRHLLHLFVVYAFVAIIGAVMSVLLTSSVASRLFDFLIEHSVEIFVLVLLALFMMLVRESKQKVMFMAAGVATALALAVFMYTQLPTRPREIRILLDTSNSHQNLEDQLKRSIAVLMSMEDLNDMQLEFYTNDNKLKVTMTHTLDSLSRLTIDLTNSHSELLELRNQVRACYLRRGDSRDRIEIFAALDQLTAATSLYNLAAWNTMSARREYSLALKRWTAIYGKPIGPDYSLAHKDIKSVELILGDKEKWLFGPTWGEDSTSRDDTLELVP